MAIRPSEVHSHYSHYITYRLSAWSLAMLGWLLVGLVSVSPSQFKLLISSVGGVAVAAANPLRRQSKRLEAQWRDMDDISHDAWQTALYQGFQELNKLIGWGLEDSKVELQQFNAEAITDPNGCTCVAIVGASGSGKSVLTQMLISAYFPNSSTAVYDTDAAPNEWPGLPVHGRKGDVGAIAEQMQLDLSLLKHRSELRGNGDLIPYEAVRIVEEFPTLAADLEPRNRQEQNIATEWLKRLSRRGRKYRIKLFLVSQEWNVEALKIGGEGELRRAFTVFYLGSSALEAIRKEPDKARRKALRQWVENQPRPCLVLHQGILHPWGVPTVSEPVSNPTDTLKPFPPETDRVKWLKQLYDASPSHPEMQVSASADVPFEALSDTLKREKIRELQQKNLKQTDIILILWHCKPGGSQAYKDAVKEFKRLMG